MSLDLTDALVGFFTTTVELPTCPAGLPAGARWWEERDGWRYPWRVVSYVEGVAQGYPCGEPERLPTYDPKTQNTGGAVKKTCSAHAVRASQQQAPDEHVPACQKFNGRSAMGVPVLP